MWELNREKIAFSEVFRGAAATNIARDAGTVTFIRAIPGVGLIRIIL